MSYYVVHASQTGVLSGMADYAQIQELFSRARLPRNSGGGEWASRVRVTRTGSLLAGQSGVTTAAALYELPDWYSNEGRDTALSALRASVDAMLDLDTARGHNTWSEIHITPWREAYNGSLAWWQCATAENCAANTMTQNANPALQNIPYENPTGPTLAGVNAPRPSDGIGMGFGLNFKPLYIGLGVIAVIALAPTVNTIIQGIGKKPEPEPVQVVANPRRKNKKHENKIKSKR